MAFLRGTDSKRYSTLWSDLTNQQTCGNDQYPKDLAAAYSMLVKYHAPALFCPANITATPTPSIAIPPLNAHTFVQPISATSKAGSEGVVHRVITCYNCNNIRHYANKCPTALTLIQYCYMLIHSATTMEESRHEGIPSDWLLLDSQSTISVFNNPKMVYYQSP
jgi:hypothetical protein